MAPAVPVTGSVRVIGGEVRVPVARTDSSTWLASPAETRLGVTRRSMCTPGWRRRTQAPATRSSSRAAMASSTTSSRPKMRPATRPTMPATSTSLPERVIGT